MFGGVRAVQREFVWGTGQEGVVANLAVDTCIWIAIQKNMNIENQYWDRDTSKELVRQNV